MKSPIIRVMEDAAFAASRKLIRDFGEIENLQVSRKGPRDFVTNADIAAEETIKEILTKARPDYGFMGEESIEIKGKSLKRWVVDPIDGTTNFMHGIPHFSISIALEEVQPTGRSEIIAALVHAPVLQETFVAEKSMGAMLNQKRLEVSSRSKLEESLVACYIRNINQEIEDANVKTLTDLRCNMRVLGSAALELAYVAAGKLDGFYCRNLKPWDVAAGILLVRESKGIVTDFMGRRNIFANGSIIATNQAIDSPLRRIVERNYKDLVK